MNLFKIQLCSEKGQLSALRHRPGTEVGEVKVTKDIMMLRVLLKVKVKVMKFYEIDDGKNSIKEEIVE